jgi:hypothetical protein
MMEEDFPSPMRKGLGKNEMICPNHLLHTNFFLCSPCWKIIENGLGTQKYPLFDCISPELIRIDLCKSGKSLYLCTPYF